MNHIQERTIQERTAALRAVAPFERNKTLAISAAAAPAPLFQIRGRAPISSTDVFTYDVAKERFSVS
jgi:hypothetical protein